MAELEDEEFPEPEDLDDENEDDSDGEDYDDGTVRMITNLLQVQQFCNYWNSYYFKNQTIILYLKDKDGQILNWAVINVGLNLVEIL